ncbi:hypothetical protein GBA52_028471 [Prunus armeniaca]|nr:hypothetical protein GBA52_028471 [Prunus armeniaca]
MAEEKESSSVPLSQAENGILDPEDPAKSPPSSPNSSTRLLLCSPKLGLKEVYDWMFVDGFFSPLYAQLGIDIFGMI